MKTREDTQIIIFTNQKGGVGKTTLTRELGITLSRRGYKVLLVDSDPQGNLSKSLLESESKGLYEALEGSGLEPVSVRDNLSIITGDSRLAALEKRYLGEVDAYEKLSAVLSKTEGFDLILIDSPPSLGVMTLNGLAASRYFVIPVRPALYSLQGTNDLLNSVAKVRKSLNPGLSLLGVVLNDYLSGPIISRQIKDEIAENFGELVFKTAVSRTVKIEEAIASKTGVTEENSKIAGEIELLADEFTLRLGLPLRSKT